MNGAIPMCTAMLAELCHSDPHKYWQEVYFDAYGRSHMVNQHSKRKHEQPFSVWTLLRNTKTSKRKWLTMTKRNGDSSISISVAVSGWLSGLLTISNANFYFIRRTFQILKWAEVKFTKVKKVTDNVHKDENSEHLQTTGRLRECQRKELQWKIELAKSEIRLRRRIETYRHAFNRCQWQCKMTGWAVFVTSRFLQCTRHENYKSAKRW